MAAPSPAFVKSMPSPSISGFTFLRNGVMLGFPFEASIRSLLPLVDEFVIAVGEGQDDTLVRIKAIQDPKIRIIETTWNERMAAKGFVYAQQKMIAQYACTGDWAFYLEGDEVLHESELATIRQSIDRHHNNPEIEALVFDYFHFYGSPDWIAISPAWYRRECRLIRNTIRSYAPDGQFWVVMEKHRRGRLPNAALANAHIYHYGHVRKLHYMQNKLDQVSKYWSGTAPRVTYSIDPLAIKPFSGSHPGCAKNWLATEAEAHFEPDASHTLTKRERRHRLMMKLESWFNLELSHKHYQLIDSQNNMQAIAPFDPHKRVTTKFRNGPEFEQEYIRLFFGSKINGIYVDVGANEPVIQSQTYHLEELGWKGILIEPIPEYCSKLRQHRTGVVAQYACSSPENNNKTLQLLMAGGHSTLNGEPIARGSIGQESIQVTCRTLDSILKEFDIPKGFDFISIDIEGHEMEMFKGFSLNEWKPKLVLLEDHVIDHKKHNHMINNGYSLILRTGLNSWYVPKSDGFKLSANAFLQYLRKYWIGLPIRKFRFRK